MFDLKEAQAKSVVQITDAMFGGSAKAKIERALVSAQKSHALLVTTKNVYADHRGNLSEASDSLSTAIMDMQGHLRDVESGAE